MRRILLAATLAAAAAPALAADVGVSIGISQPGMYGRIDIGSFPRPPVIYAEPMIMQPLPPGVVRQPIYLHVPPGHAKDWRKHCGKYNACNQPVYFVQENWYNDVYAPRYQGGGGRGYDRDGDQGRRGYDRGPGPRGYDRDDDQGRGRDKGHGHGHGRGRD